jgi:hypothetical protein
VVGQAARRSESSSPRERNNFGIVGLNPREVLRGGDGNRTGEEWETVRQLCRPKKGRAVNRRQEILCKSLDGKKVERDIVILEKAEMLSTIWELGKRREQASHRRWRNGKVSSHQSGKTTPAYQTPFVKREKSYLEREMWCIRGEENRPGPIVGPKREKVRRGRGV